MAETMIALENLTDGTETFTSRRNVTKLKKSLGIV